MTQPPRARFGHAWRRVGRSLTAMTAALPWRGTPTLVEPPEVHDPPPDPRSHEGDAELRDQQHVDQAPPLEHGHPKR